MSPTLRPLDSAGVLGSMAETTTGLDPWMRKPNSPLTRWTQTVWLHSEMKQVYSRDHHDKLALSISFSEFG